MTGGDNSSTVSSVSAEVEAYEPLIGSMQTNMELVNMWN